MINDCHVHIGREEDINRTYTIDDLIKWRKDFPYIDKVLVMGTSAEPNNELIKDLVHEHDWLYGLHWWVNGAQKVEIDDKIIGMKYHGKYMNRPVTRINERYFEKMNQLKCVLMVHCGRYLEGDIKSNTSYLHALQVARNYPKIKVILAHMGGTDTTVCKKAIHHGQGLRNVYFDTSGITTPYIIEYAQYHIPPDRILFGSDMPWCSFSAMVWTVADAFITRLAKDQIFEKNFELLLK